MAAGPNADSFALKKAFTYAKSVFEKAGFHEVKSREQLDAKLDESISGYGKAVKL